MKHNKYKEVRLLPYFPFDDDTFKMKMGIHALNDNSLIEVDETAYHEELALKQQLLAEEYHQYFRALPNTEAMQWDVVELILPTMSRLYPQHFALLTDGDSWLWRNRLLDTETQFLLGDSSSLPLPPLDWLGRQVQEDLLVMSDTQGMPLVAGHLCFPNSWCLEDKLGLSLLDIHLPVPLFAGTLARPTSLLLERLKVGRPVTRVNWSIKATPRLNFMPRYAYEEQQAYQYFTTENIGERCFLRLERQTLSRLPRTKAILFTIRTYQAPIAEIVRVAEYACRIAGVLRTMPHEMQAYKALAPCADVLLAYLDKRVM